MGVFEAAVVAMRGGLDWPRAYGLIEQLRGQVGELPDAEVAGDGLLIPQHLHVNECKAELMKLVDDAEQLLNQANQLCVEVLRRL